MDQHPAFVISTLRDCQLRDRLHEELNYRKQVLVRMIGIDCLVHHTKDCLKVLSAAL